MQALLPPAININRSSRLLSHSARRAHMYFPTFIISPSELWVFSREALRATICNKDGHWLNMGVPRTKDFLLAKKKCTVRAYSIAVCVLFYSRSLGKGVDDFFKQRSSERKENLVCDGQGVLTRASTVWFSPWKLMQQLSINVYSWFI